MTKCLNRKFDQPFEAFLQAIKTVKAYFEFAYNQKNLDAISRDGTKTLSIIKRYADGTVDQMFTALIEATIWWEVVEGRLYLDIKVKILTFDSWSTSVIRETGCCRRVELRRQMLPDTPPQTRPWLLNTTLGNNSIQVCSLQTTTQLATCR